MVLAIFSHTQREGGAKLRIPPAWGAVGQHSETLFGSYGSSCFLGSIEVAPPRYLLRP